MPFASFSPSISSPAEPRLPRIALWSLRRGGGLLARMLRLRASRKPRKRAPLSEHERILISNLSALR